MSIQKSHNINFATLFSNNNGNVNTENGYSGLQIEFQELIQNNIDSFTINGNVLSVNGTNLSIILPNTTVLGVDEQTGNWVINGIKTKTRARGIDGTVSFDSLSADQKKQLTFTEISVNTLSPGNPASGSIIDSTQEGQFSPLKRKLQLNIPKGDRGDLLFANFEIDDNCMLNLIFDEEYHGVNFQIDENGYLFFDTSEIDN